MKSDRYSRQSFLGPNAQEIITKAVIGIAGAGGGGSHIIQQAAHIGFQNFVIYDPQRVDAEKTNLTRLVGATVRDAEDRSWKTDIAERVIRGLQPEATVLSIRDKWQKKPEPLRSCDLIFGAADGFSERKELEAEARRYLIPLIDVGLSVHTVADEPPRMSGQVFLSMPGNLCMFCIGLLTVERLAREAERYGDAGFNPQVIWANSVLASTAVGIAIDLLTSWTRSRGQTPYLEYDGNKGTVSIPLRLEYLKDLPCEHYPSTELGDIML